MGHMGKGVPGSMMGMCPGSWSGHSTGSGKNASSLGAHTDHLVQAMLQHLEEGLAHTTLAPAFLDE